jgi:hypothetical protein
MTLDLTDDEARALAKHLRRLGAYRSSGQQTIPTAKIIVKVQNSLFFIADYP